MDALVPGSRIVDVSGIRVGHVARVEDGRFLVERDGSGVGPLWLMRDAVFNITEGVVTLLCNESDLERYSTEPPAGPPS